MRCTELLALKWEDIDCHLKRVQVRRTIMRIPGEGFKLLEPKIARRLCEIPLMPLAIDAIERHRARKQEAKQAEFPLINFHDVRNGTAALLIASGVPAQIVADLLGYSVSFNTLFPIPYAILHERRGHCTPGSDPYWT